MTVVAKEHAVKTVQAPCIQNQRETPRLLDDTLSTK